MQFAIKQGSFRHQIITHGICAHLAYMALLIRLTDEIVIFFVENCLAHTHLQDRRRRSLDAQGKPIVIGKTSSGHDLRQS